MLEDHDISQTSDLSAEERQQIAEGLQNLLATTLDLYLCTQMAHWNVKGPSFVGLHELFQKHYEELAAAIDEIAERIRALGFFITGSLSELLAQSRLSKATVRGGAATAWIELLTQGHLRAVQTARETLPAVEQARDGGSADLLGRRLLAHEQAVWMLRSHRDGS